MALLSAGDGGSEALPAASRLGCSSAVREGRPPPLRSASSGPKLRLRGRGGHRLLEVRHELLVDRHRLDAPALGDVAVMRPADHDDTGVEVDVALPQAARRRVATFLRESGEAWAHSAHALHKALVRNGFVVPGPDHRPEMQVRVGDGKRRVLRVRLTALPRRPCTRSRPGLVPEFRRNRRRLRTRGSDGRSRDTEVMSPASPTSPGSEGRYPWDEN